MASAYQPTNGSITPKCSPPTAAKLPHGVDRRPLIVHVRELGIDRMIFLHALIYGVIK
jgi:hypothetical protein